MTRKKTFITLICAILLQIVAYILLDRPFATDATTIVKELILNLLRAPETIVKSRNFSLDSIMWSVIPWLLAGFIGGLASKSPQKGAIGGILATLIVLILFIIVLLLLDGIGVGALLNNYGEIILIGFITAAIEAGVGGALGGTITQE